MNNISTPSHDSFLGSPNLSSEPFPNAATANQEISAYSLGAVWQKNILPLAKQDLSSIALVSKKMLAFVRAIRQQEASCDTLVRLSRWINYLPKSENVLPQDETALQEVSSKSVRERIQDYHESFLKQNSREEVKAGQNFFQPVEDAEKLFIEYWNRVFVPELRKQEPNKLKEYISNLNIEDPELKSLVSLAVFGKFIDFKGSQEEVIAQIRQHFPVLIRDHISTCEDLSALVESLKKLSDSNKSALAREMLTHLVTHMNGLRDKTMASHFVSLLAKDKDFALKHLDFWHQLDFTHIVHSNVAGHLIQFLTQNKIPNGLDELTEAEKKGYEQELIELACAFDKRFAQGNFVAQALFYIIQHSPDLSAVANSVTSVVSFVHRDMNRLAGNAYAVFEGLNRKGAEEGVRFFKQLLNQIASNSPDQHLVEFLFHVCDTEAYNRLVKFHEGREFVSTERNQPEKRELRDRLFEELVTWAGQHPSIAKKLLLASHPVISLKSVQYLTEKTTLPQAACLPLLERALQEPEGEVLLQKILESAKSFPFYKETLSYLAELAEKKHFPLVEKELKDRVRHNVNLLDSSKLHKLSDELMAETGVKDPSKLKAWIGALTSHLDIKIVNSRFSTTIEAQLQGTLKQEDSHSLFQQEMFIHHLARCILRNKYVITEELEKKLAPKRLKLGDSPSKIEGLEPYLEGSTQNKRVITDELDKKLAPKRLKLGDSPSKNLTE